MNEFKVESYANFGTGEPWVARLMLGLQELVYAVPAFGVTRDAFMNELVEVFESLGMAFEELRAVRSFVDPANSANVSDYGVLSYETGARR